jgi:putative membrane-bound dehydrogenase-like protein
MQRLVLAGCLFGLGLHASAAHSHGNRLNYIDQTDPFHVGVHFPRLTTPQWVGEPGVDAVITMGIDDLRQSERYEAFLRPILERLKAIDGRAPLSIFCNALDPRDPRFQQWLSEGLSLEVHTLSHPCPLLTKGDFVAAQNTFHGGVELLNHVPGNLPVAFRTPCCDSINSPSPRVFAELLAHTNAAGQFLRMDSSVLMLLTTNDPALPRELVVDREARERFSKYVPFRSFVTTVENYPYPWLIGTIWEFPCMAPSDWEAHNLLGDAHPQLLEDWKAALAAVVLKQGVFNFVFHPYGWSSSSQMVEFINHAVSTYGTRITFLNYHEAHDRLTRYLTAGQPLRTSSGADNGVRLVDLNHDGFLDVLIGNPALRRTRLWLPDQNAWHDTSLPVSIVETASDGVVRETGVRFGVMHRDGRATMLIRTPNLAGAWTFQNREWVPESALLDGLELAGQPVFTRAHTSDRGVRLRDVDNDGVCELLVANDTQSGILRWDRPRRRWQAGDWSLPGNAPIVNARGEDNGVRFVDINEDGYHDWLFSNEHQYGLWLFQPEFHLGWAKGWTRKVTAGKRASIAGADFPAPAVPPEEIPAIVRDGAHRNNGAWVRSRHLWFQNEDTAHLPDLVDRRSFDDLLRGPLPPALPPSEALRSFLLRPGFRIELVAAEPLVQDPVAFDWDAAGRLWVVEMRDYPLGIHGKPGGVVKFLEDQNRDGTWDRATEFLRDLNYPTGVMPWRNGVLISAAPDVFYAEDSDGDGRADVHRVLLSGFNEGNQQHRVNGFAPGLDGWVYGANGDSGGTLRSPYTEMTASLRGRDFRFRPDTGEFEVIEGQTQFGRVRDDWGNWFGNANYTWLWHYPWPSRYLARNPHLIVRDPRWQLAKGPGQNRLYPRSPPLPRPNAVGEENTVTSACSPAPYRDQLFGPDFATSIFIAEPSENIVHREIVTETEAGFTSHRAAGEETSEFLASHDPWFRPVFLRTGPDGALYIADMYRLIIEHPEWIPPDLQRTVDVRAGDDRGRIYRVAPDSARLRPVPNLKNLNPSGLASAMDSPNGWQRDTTMRLLCESRATNAVPALQLLCRTAANPKVRLQAFATLRLLGGIDRAILATCLADAHPAVRVMALRASEAFLKTDATEIKRAVAELVNDPSPSVARQLAFTLGEWPDPVAAMALIKLAYLHPDHQILSTPILSSALPHLAPMLKAAADRAFAPALLEGLVRTAASTDTPDALDLALRAILRLDPARAPETQWTSMAAVLETRESSPELITTGTQGLASVILRASECAFDPEASSDSRLAALRLLGVRVASSWVPAERFESVLTITEPIAIRKAAIAALRRRDEPAAPETLLRAWNHLEPSLREATADALLTRANWTSRLLDGLEQGRPAPRELSVAARDRLLKHADAPVRDRASRLFSAVATDRDSVVQRFVTGSGSTGDASRGRELYLEHCSSCHRSGGDGFEVGPDLGAIADKSRDALLIAILDPNRAVEDRYLGFTAITRDGREFTGVIAGEAPNTLTLRNAAGSEVVFTRSDVSDFRGTGRSLMPEGFELTLDGADLTDLLAYLMSTP